MRVGQARSVVEYIQIVSEIRSRWRVVGASQDEELWYRGVRSASYRLLPGAYRQAGCDDVTLFAYFQQIAPAYVERPPRTDWEWYFLAQHFGLPTRLLDWTLSPLAALYFAVCDNENSARVPAVWMIDAGSLNLVTIGCDELVAPRGKAEFSKHWLPWEASDSVGSCVFEFEGQRCSCELPMAILPFQGERRIAAQQGMFTIHGRSRVPLEKLLVRARDPAQRRVAKIVFPHADRSVLLRELRELGVRKSSMFPELASVAEDLIADFTDS